jgi:prepilin-type N-terminal cleavage/methylation domain-containing protein
MGELESTAEFEKRLSSQNMRQILAKSQGYTMFELIMVVVLISIVSVSVLPKFFDTSSITVAGAAKMVVADIRYAQELAMSSNDDKKVDFTQDSSSYMLKHSNDTVFRTVALPSGVTVSSASVIFTFNSLGEPLAGGSVTISVDGLSPQIITVDPNTGRVSIL